ncbi:hypothetical protein DPMN_108577 [Dreissena polymorpha]|uniref:Uncharacterized protein n=1 Tax=Dreissena polymorpha TaxID=45954 RepID=A0A9D4QLC4_DREPO|nr:hypothetical protein DPMN_108577 [Dreissena polymorpha]
MQHRLISQRRGTGKGVIVSPISDTDVRPSICTALAAFHQLKNINFDDPVQ